MNNLVTSVLLVTLLVVAAAYNFEDAYFKQLFPADLDHVAFTRNRRAVPLEEDEHTHKRLGLCCADELFKTVHENEKELMDSCYKEVTGNDAPLKNVKPKREDIWCVMQCVGQKNNVLDSDGNIKENEYSKFVKEKLAGTPYLAAVQRKILDDILQDVKNIRAYAGASSDKCNPTGARLARGFFKHIQLNCPDANIKDKELCSRLQEGLRQGQRVHPLD